MPILVANRRLILIIIGIKVFFLLHNLNMIENQLFMQKDTQYH